VPADTIWLTLTEIARRIGRPPSTVGYWRDTYRDVLEERADDQGHATYDLAALAMIGEMVGRRASRAEIRSALTGRADEPSRERPFEAAVLERLDRILAAVERIADRLDPPEPR
jgi:transposase-like protein